MAMTFSSKGCTEASNSLKKSARSLDAILNTRLNRTITNTKDVYASSTATELYAFYEKMRAKFPDFIDAINDCAKYLSDTVAPAYAKVEAEAARKIGE